MKHKNLLSLTTRFCQQVKFLCAFEAGIICYSPYYVDVMLACLKESNKDIIYRFNTVFFRKHTVLAVEFSSK